MVCTNCGESGHNTKTCPALLSAEANPEKRGQRASPRTPADDKSKLDKLVDISKKLSPKPVVPPLPEGAASSGRSSDPTNADIMARLDTMMGTMTVKEDLQELRKEMTDQTRTMISEAVDPLKNEMADVKHQCEVNGARLASIEKRVDNGASPADRTIHAKVALLEHQLHAMRQGYEQGFVAVVGGLDVNVSENEAVKFVEDKIKETGLTKPTDIYPKGTYAGFMYAKFAKKTDRDSCIERLKKAGIVHNGAKTWVDEERTKEDRAIRGFLFGLKKLLVSWEWDKMAVWVDTDKCFIKLGDDEVATASVGADGFKVNYEPDWEQYLKGPDLDALTEAAQKKVRNAGSKGASKAKGKGKSTSE